MLPAKTIIEEILTLPLADIHADKAWNSRSGSYEQSTTTADDGTGVVGLALSILEDGQDAPVHIRKNPDPSSKQPYALVDGFRRYAAIALNERNTGKPQTIRAELRELTETEACALNLRENLHRENIPPSDQAWGIARILESDRSLTYKDVAKLIGKTEAYTQSLAFIIENTKTSRLAEMWRRSPLPVPVEEMLRIARQPAEEQRALYDAAVMAKRDRHDPNIRLWFKVARRVVGKRGAFLGSMVREGVIVTQAIDWERAVWKFADLSIEKHSPTHAQIQILANIGLEAFEEAKTKVTHEELAEREALRKDRKL